MKKTFFVILSLFLISEAFSQHEEIMNTGTEFETRKSKGYFNVTQASMLMGNREITAQGYLALYNSMPYSPYYSSYTRNVLQFSPSVTMTNGYIFNEHWAAGIGIGVEIFTKNIFPIFADIRYTLRDNGVSPIYALKTGYAIGNLKEKHHESLYFDFEPFNAYNADVIPYGGSITYLDFQNQLEIYSNFLNGFNVSDVVSLKEHEKSFVFIFQDYIAGAVGDYGKYIYNSFGATSLINVNDTVFALGRQLDFYLLYVQDNYAHLKYINRHSISGTSMLKEGNTLIVANKQGLSFYNISNLLNNNLHDL